jgi:alpha-galactosidase
MGRWAAVERNAAGQQVAVPSKFPRGMHALADKVHAMNLSFGLYTALAAQTCGGLYMAGAGSCNHEVEDAMQYADWTVDFVKDDGCGGCHGNESDPSLASYAAIQKGITESGRQIYLTTESSPNLTRHAEAPDVYGNSHRTGHDSQPAWGSVVTQMDIASNLWSLVHNDTDGHGGYYNDLDMLQIGQGDFDPRTGGVRALNMARSHFTQHIMLKSTLLLSTVLSELPDEVMSMFLNKEVVAIHQDPWGKQARRVSSVRPAVTELVPPFNAWMVLKKCEKGNPRQIWHHSGGEPGPQPSAPGRLWTTDEAGKRWCFGEASWARYVHRQSAVVCGS